MGRRAAWKKLAKSTSFFAEHPNYTVFSTPCSRPGICWKNCRAIREEFNAFYTQCYRGYAGAPFPAGRHHPGYGFGILFHIYRCVQSIFSNKAREEADWPVNRGSRGKARLYDIIASTVSSKTRCKKAGETSMLLAYAAHCRQNQPLAELVAGSAAITFWAG